MPLYGHNLVPSGGARAADSNYVEVRWQLQKAARTSAGYWPTSRAQN